MADRLDLGDGRAAREALVAVTSPVEVASPVVGSSPLLPLDELSSIGSV